MKWHIRFCLLCFLFCSCIKKADESEAIKRLLEKESAAWRSGDVQAHADCWKIQPYSRILVSNAEGKTFDVPPNEMINPSPNSMGKGGSSVNTNYKIIIYSNNAWVSHDEESTGKDGKKSYSREIRLLEKIHGSWKLVGQSIHVYKLP